MNYISAENLSQSFAEKWLFKNLSVGVNYGEKIGLIGVNGCGKSTLLKTLAGVHTPDGGEVSVKKDTKVGFLGQNPVFDEDKSVYDNVFFSDNSTMLLVNAYEEHVNSDSDHKDYNDKLNDLIDKMNQAEAWDYEQQTKEIISRLGIGEFIERPVKHLSGGQRKRVAMARVLIDKPDVLILDEPTNHLDLETIEWLEETINNNYKTVLMVTHDRYFLDKICNQIYEIDNGQLYKYKGNYGYFLEKKAEREQIENSEIDKAKNLFTKELDWIRRQPKARGTKAKYRVEAFDVIKEKAGSRKVESKLDLQIKTTRQGGKVLNLKNLSKKYDDLVLLDKFTHNFLKGEKIGIVGKNGVGKSTFLNMITGELKADSGDFDKGDNTVFGFYKQEHFELDPDMRLIEVVKEIAEFIELANGEKISASSFLKMFLFPPEVQYNNIGKLSGGEKKRLQLMMVLIKNPNFLILDEPTNDLDIVTLNVLEDFLDNFGGTLILVSHDRYFMDRLVDHLFVFEGDGIVRDFNGNYTDYRESLKETKQTNQAEVKKIAPVEIKTETVDTKKKLNFKEKTEYDNLTKELANLEKEKEILIQKLNLSNIPANEVVSISEKIGTISNLIDQKELIWLELDERN